MWLYGESLSINEMKMSAESCGYQEMKKENIRNGVMKNNVISK
jgi:hypothetical protein